ncbi:hypothetical protein BGZ65_006788, partial [Modicella reniformis]
MCGTALWNKALNQRGVKRKDVPAEETSSTTIENTDKDAKYRACSVTLKSVLRPDLEDHVERIEKLLSRGQNIVSNVVDELHAVMHKAVFAIASGDIYPSHIGTSKEGFNISRLLPSKYSSGSQEINVAPIPKDLQRHLENAKDDDEVLRIFSKEHIQRLYAAFLGIQKSSKTTDDLPVARKGSTDRPCWNAIERAIRSNSSIRKPEVTADGLSRTMLEHMTQMATSMKAVQYTRSPDYVCNGDLHREIRVIMVLQKLEALQKVRPSPVQTQFEKIESQLAKSVVEDTVNLDDENEDEDEDEDQDKDEDKDKEDGEKDVPAQNSEGNMQNPLGITSYRWPSGRILVKEEISDNECDV